MTLTFESYAVKPGDRVTLHVDGTRSGRPVRLYLVERAHARTVRSRYDARLHFVGTVVPRRAHGVLRFEVPPLESGVYVAWCAGCRANSAPLQVTMPAATAAACPVTIPNGSVPPGVPPASTYHGNGALWTSLPQDGRHVNPNPTAPLFLKMPWGARGATGRLFVRSVRLDASAPAVDAETIPGTWHGFRGSASWASRMYFDDGCWKVTGRVADISLSFVVHIVRP